MIDLELIVLVKQVPDIEEVEFDMETGRIDRSSAETLVNPFDLNALEAAVQLKEERGGTVTTISMGPPQAESALRKTLARGADRAILLSDKGFAGADTRATSFTLAKAIEKLGKFDFIFCGEKTIDGDTAQVGSWVAELLDIPHVAYVSDVTFGDTDEELLVKSEVWGATYTKKLRVPGLITVTKDINEPRLPALKAKLRAKNAEITSWTIDAFPETNPEEFGIKGSRTTVESVEIPEKREREGEMLRGDPSENADKLIQVFRKAGVLR